jgi:hypothetical protein
MIHSVPKIIFGALICAAALWTNLAQGTSLKLELEIFKDQSITDPYYKRYLKFMGSWFMGDQVGETAVNQGVGGSDMNVAQYLYTFLPILKRAEAHNKKTNKFLDKKLGDQVKNIENGLIIYETIEKLVKPDLNPAVKAATIKDLNDKIFENVENGDTVVIPVTWKNTKPGSMLMTVSKQGSDGVLRVFDTFYTFSSNSRFDDENLEYPQRVVPWREINFNLNRIKTFKFLVLGLINLRDDANLDKYFLEAEKDFATNLLFKTAAPQDSRENSDIARLYLYKVFFPVFGKFASPNSFDVTWPLNTFKMGPVGDILAYFSQISDDFGNFPAWKLETGYSLLKLFLKRFSSDSDIHQETRSRVVVAEILKRSANRLLRDAFEFTRVQKWIPSQVGEKDNTFWKYLHTNKQNQEKIETYLRRVKGITAYSASKKIKDISVYFEKNYDEIFGANTWATVESEIKTKINNLVNCDGELQKLEKEKNDKLEEIKKLKSDLYSQFRNDPKNTNASSADLKKKARSIESDDSVQSLKKEYEQLVERFKAKNIDRKKLVDVLIEQAKKAADEAAFKLPNTASDEENQAKLKLIKAVMKLREQVLAWIKEKNLDTLKLRKLTRSLEQREVPVKQNIHVIFRTTLEEPVDLTEYNQAGSLTTDFSNCMSGIDITISSLKDFITAFSNMKPVWHWSRFSHDIPFPHCRPFFRRNAELLLKKMQLGGLDKGTLAKWTPKNQKEYNEFNTLSLIILDSISNLPSIERTLEDYLIVMRLQRVVWKVAQALDAKFAIVEPQRHLDLIQYTLSFPQCHRLLKNQMSYQNYFLADSGAFGNILNYDSVFEMKELCKSLVEDEKFSKPVLNSEKYSNSISLLVKASMFDSVDPGDREIYFKMAQNPKIAQMVRENVNKFGFKDASFAGVAARAASLGHAGSQFIYYQFFDVVKIVLASNMAINKQVSVNLPIKITYMPFLQLGSILLVLPTKDNSVTKFTTVNEELIKKNKKSYLKASITEMITSHILGLDVIVNHMSRGSPKFWSSGNILNRRKEESSFFGKFKFIKSIEHIIKELSEVFKSAFPNNEKFVEDRFELKAYRRDVAGTADFFLNCSAHLLRKLDIAPNYEELVMTLLMKTFSSVDDELDKVLKKIEQQEINVDKEMEDKKNKDANEKKEGKENDKNQNGTKEMEENQNYLKKGKTSPDERLKSLINWATIAIRFTTRIRALKPEWKDRYADIPKKFYSTMIKYSRIQKGNNRRLSHLNKNLVAHVDFLLFMICSMNMNDHNLRLEIYTNLKPDASDEISFPQDSSVLPAAMVLHRLLALSHYEYDLDAPLTEDFVSNQFGIDKVMTAISLLAERNESFLALIAEYMSPYLSVSPKEILGNYTQGDNLAKGVLIYGRFALNFIQGTFSENGSKARDPNAILRYSLFREFFSSGNEQIIPTLGKETKGCPYRYEVENFLAKNSKYSICEDTKEKRIKIYRKIESFRKPCMLVRRKRVINALQRDFSIYPIEGVDLYHCVRGNNAHFVWINRNSEEPSYISHGRLTKFYDAPVEFFFNDEVVKILESISKNDDIEEFQLDKKTKVDDKKLTWKEFLFLPRIDFPKLEIREVDKKPIFPITAESKLMVVPEPMIRFSGGTHFGTYILNNNLVFMFQQFRFRDLPEVSLTFIEKADGNLEMKGREDLKVCEDQIFENNFWPALMLRKNGESGERRFAYVPIANSEIIPIDESKFHEEISCKYDPEKALNDPNYNNNSLIFMEEYPVEKFPVSEAKNADGKTKIIYGYKLKPTSRLQRLLLAFHNLRLRNYDVCLKLLDPRSEIDHNTPLNPDEIKVLKWMVSLRSGQEPEAYALRLMAQIHLILDSEIFPAEFIQSPGTKEVAEDISDKVITDDKSLVEIYAFKNTVNYADLDRLDEDVNESEFNFDGDTKLGRYFAFLPLLPKRFHIDQVFQEAMASQKIQKVLRAQYKFGIKYPERPGKSLFFFLKQCDYKDYISYQAFLDKKILKPLSKSEEEKLEKYAADRFIIPYAALNCDLPRMLVQKFLQIHDSDQEIPRNLQELAVIYYNLTGNPISYMDQYLFVLSDPGFLSTFTIKKLRSKIDLKRFETELEPVVIDGIKQYPPKYSLDEFGALLIHSPRKLYLQMDDFDITFAGVLKLPAVTEQTTDPSKIFEPILPKAPNVENAIKEREINSIKFMSEDLHYIGIEDREIYQKTIVKIDEGRLDKASAINVGLAKINGGSKTLKGLETAINDYMKKRIEPIEFDKLEKDLFKALKANIKKKVESLAVSMKRLEAKYARFYLGTTNSKKNLLQATTVLSSIKRIFNNGEIPALKDLRDCFMQLSRSCLRNRLPEMPETSIVKIAQLLKTYYIQRIIFNNLNAINEKIENFDKLVVKAAEVQVKLDAAKKSSGKKNEIRDLEDEIFDHKDTALLSVEDIYVDMEKLLKLEQRLKDPVVLNFEFMSAKFHLTKVQVMDIASLASRNWEEELKRTIIEKYIDENLKAKAQTPVVGAKIRDAFTRFCKLIMKFYPELTPKNSNNPQSAADSKIQEKSEKSRKFGTLEELKNLANSSKPEDEETLKEKLNEIWSYMPRDERRIKEDHFKAAKENLYKERPVLERLKSIGELQPYDTSRDAYFSRVIQRKMAAGKTTVLGTAATVKKADGKTLSVLVILSALYQSSAPDMQKRTSEFFNTRGFAFSMPKPRLTVPKADEQNHPARNFLLWTLKTLINTINSNSYLVVTPETLQSFLNSYVEFLDAFINSPGGRLNRELSQCLHLFATIYDIFRTRGSIILDEIDSSMRPQKELNFPTTKREGILLSGVELSSDLLLHSAFNKEINEAGLNLLANQQAALNNDQYDEVHKLWRKYVTDQLNDKNSIWHKTFFPKNQDLVASSAELIKFFFEPSPLDLTTAGKTKEMEDEIDRLVAIKAKSEKIFHAMMVVKMQLKNWLKNCFKGSVNEHYGPSLNKSGQEALYYAIPYMAANTPAEGSIFADRWETVNKTFMMYLVKNLSLEDLSMILLDLRTLSQGNAQSIDVKAEFMNACPEFDLLNLKFNAQNRLVDKSGKVMQCMKSRSPSALKLIFYWVTKIVFETQQFYAEQITSNAINLTTMFPSVQGYSGTIDNVNILPHQVMIEAEIDHRKNEQANGAIAMKLLQQKDCVTTVQKIEIITEIDKLLDAMCRDFKDLSAFSAFIDAGALLKDFKNAEVAFALGRKFKRDIILFYDERTNQLSFHDPKNGPQHVTALEGSETKYLNSATNSLVKNRFTYYDQRHITGSDILQPPTAKAFLTIGPKVLLRDILQGVMRMRQFQSGQSIHFVTTSAVETLLSKFSSSVQPVNSDGKPRVDQSHLIALGALNEDEKQLNENVRLYRVKIDAEIRAFVLDLITEGLARADPFKERVIKSNSNIVDKSLAFGFNHEKLFEHTRSLFIRNVKENPVNWASVNTVIAAKAAVQKYMQQRIDMIPDIWKTDINYQAKWNEVNDNLKKLTEEITKNDKSDEMKLVQKARSVLGYLGDTLEISEISSKFAAPTSETVDLGSTIEMELQLELQQELQLELEQQILDGNSDKPVSEPIIMLPFESYQSGLVSSAIPGLEKSPDFVIRNTPFDAIDATEGLLTPWKLYSKYASTSGDFSEALKNIFRADIFCPSLLQNENAVEKYCQSIPGFVGMSLGLAKVTTSSDIDFVTMASREGTHLLFWRGRADSSKTNNYKYAIFLISGSEALSLHKNWQHKSSSIGPFDSFWLTDLYGFEVHGSPFASTSLSSNHFSLLESEYNEHFIDLHFRALLLNASYNVIMASKAMYDRMRAWIGDFGMMKKLDPTCKTGVKRETIEKRVRFFINRLSWMSKLRDEIVPDDPFIKDILKIYANQQVEFEVTADKYKGQLNRGQTDTYSDTMASPLIDSEDPKAKPWKNSKNINKSEPVSILNWLIFVIVVFVLVGIILVWGRSVGIYWPDFFKAKWFWLISLFSKSAESAIQSVDSSETVEGETETDAQIAPTESVPQSESKSESVDFDDENSIDEN